MNFKVISDPDLLFEVQIISFSDEQTARSLATAESEDGNFVIEYSWKLNKVSDKKINIELVIEDSYIISVGDTVHMLQVV